MFSVLIKAMILVQTLLCLQPCCLCPATGNSCGQHSLWSQALEKHSSTSKHKVMAVLEVLSIPSFQTSLFCGACGSWMLSQMLCLVQPRCSESTQTHQSV